MYCKVVLALLVSYCALQAMAHSTESTEKDINEGLMQIDTTNETAVRTKFEEYKQKFKPNYANEEEAERRFRIFQTNLAKIQKMNQNPDDTATYGINQFTDKNDEDMKMYTGLRRPTKE